MTDISPSTNELKNGVDLIGDTPLSPFSPEFQCQGITYKQYLVAQALNGLCQRSASNGFIAMTAIKLADEVLTQLAQEVIEKQRGSND